MSVDYVLVKARKDELLEVRDRLVRLGSVREVHPLFGEWDFLLKVQGEALIDGADVVNKIRLLEGILGTRWLGVSRFGNEVAGPNPLRISFAR